MNFSQKSFRAMTILGSNPVAFRELNTSSSGLRFSSEKKHKSSHLSVENPESDPQHLPRGVPSMVQYVLFSGKNCNHSSFQSLSFFVQAAQRKKGAKN